MAHFGFRLLNKDDLESAVQTVIEAGGSLIDRGEHQPGVRFGYVADPDGYAIEL